MPKTPASTALTNAIVLPHPRTLLELGPHRGAHRVAIRAGISIAVPLLVLWATGHAELSLYATFGAFTALYGRMHTHLPRLRMQATAGATLVLAVVTGTAIGTTPVSEWLVVPAVALGAGAAAFLAEALAWHPPGPLFVVFAMAACASIPSDTDRILEALLVSAASAAFSMLVGAIGLARPRAWRLPPTPFSASFSAAAARPGQLLDVSQYVVGILITGAIGLATGFGHPYWAMVAAVAALSGTDTAARLMRAGHRVLGTLAGVAIAAGLFALHLSPLATIAVVVVLQMGAELFATRNYGLTMLFVTPMALAMAGFAHAGDGAVLLVDRTFETLVGAVIGVLVALVAHARRRTLAVTG